MAIWTELARAGNAAGDEILLRQRDEIYEIRYNGLELMSNVNFQSETVLAERSLRLLGRSARRILIGGLGMGFTLRAALNCVSETTEVTVCELIPEIIDWNHTYIGHLANYPLQDSRVEVRVGDVMVTLANSRGQYDLILMDTDNGPDFLVRSENNKIYARSGLDLVKRALMRGGIASFWSATVAPDFEALLDDLDCQWERQDICLLSARADAFHHIYFVTQKPDAVAIVDKEYLIKSAEAVA